MGYDSFKQVCESASEVKEYGDSYVLMDRWLKNSNSRWGVYGEAETESQGFAALEMALEELWPDITILQYRRICRTMVHYGTINDDDYYNERVYYMKYIRLEDLYEYLKTWGIV